MVLNIHWTYVLTNAGLQKFNNFVYLVKQNKMTVEITDKDYVTIRVSKKIGKAGIKRLTDYAQYLEINKDAPKKSVSKKVIAELADEITAAAWEKLKKKRGFKW